MFYLSDITIFLLGLLAVILRMNNQSVTIIIVTHVIDDDITSCWLFLDDMSPFLPQRYLVCHTVVCAHLRRCGSARCSSVILPLPYYHQPIDEAGGNKGSDIPQPDQQGDAGCDEEGGTEDEGGDADPEEREEDGRDECEGEGTQDEGGEE